MTQTETDDFIKEVKQELIYLGLNQNYIVKHVGMTKSRLITLMAKKARFKQVEVIKIKDLLGLD